MGKLFNLFEEAYLYEAAVATGAVPAQAAQAAPMTTNQKLALGAAGLGTAGAIGLGVDDYLEHQQAAAAAEEARQNALEIQNMAALQQQSNADMVADLNSRNGMYRTPKSILDAKPDSTAQEKMVLKEMNTPVSWKD